MKRNLFYRRRSYLFLLLIYVILGCSQVSAREPVAELVSERTLFSKTVLNDDMTLTMDFSSTPIFYENEEGELLEIVTDLEAVDEEPKDGASTNHISSTLNEVDDLSHYDYQVVKNVIKSYFNSNNAEVKVALGDDWLTMRPLGIEKIESFQSEGNALYFTEIWPGNDLVYHVNNGMVKEDIIIKSPNSIGKYIFEVYSPTLSMKVGDSGDLLFLNENNEEVFAFPSPFMIDSSKSPRHGSAKYVILESRENYGKIEIIVDKKWLMAEDTKYPVTIDPNVMVNSKFTKEQFFEIEYAQTIDWACELKASVNAGGCGFYIDKSNGYRKLDKRHGKNTIEYSGKLDLTPGTWKVGVWVNNNWANGSVTYETDTSGPNISKFKINNDASTTRTNQVTLNIEASDVGSGLATDSMRFSNNGRDYSAWEPYTTSKSWTLTGGDGTKTVYIQMRDNLDHTSTSSDSIKYDTTGPTSNYFYINNRETQIKSRSVTLKISASDVTSGVSQMQFKNEGDSYQSWQDYTTTKSWTLSSGDGYKKVYIRLKDNAGNSSTFDTGNILLDATAPWPRNGFNPSGTLNLREGTSTEDGTIKAAYEANDKLQYTFSWNAFVDTDSNHPVYSGFKEHNVEIRYQKNGSTYSVTSGSRSGSSLTEIVEWNSLYQLRVNGEDNVGNESHWYPSNSSYFETYTPAKPTEIRRVNFTSTHLNVEFDLVGSDATAYKIAWKKVGQTGGYTNSTGWITPSNPSNPTHTYTGSIRILNFEYGKQYQFAIATKNMNGTIGPFMATDLTAMPNRPPYSPIISEPTDGSYYTSSTVDFLGQNTGDPDMQTVTLSFAIDKIVENSSGRYVWSNNVKTLDRSSGEITFDQNGHYRVRLIADDGIDTTTTSAEFYVDTRPPEEPIFELQSEDGSRYTDQSTITVKLTDYKGTYTTYPFPHDKVRINDFYYLTIDSPLDVEKTVYKIQLSDDAITYTLNTAINGAREITVTSFDKAGNSTSNSRTIIYDSLSPEVLYFSDSLSTYFSNSEKKVTFNWPDAVDQPGGSTANSGIASYEIWYERPEGGTTDSVTVNQSQFDEELDYNEQINFKVRAKDGAGNLQSQWSNELIWYSKAEPLSVAREEILIEETTSGSGLYQKRIKLYINQGRCRDYKVYPFDTTLANKPVQGDPSENLTDWIYTYDVQPHHSYKFYLNSFNELGKTTDQLNSDIGYSTRILNSLPTTPVIAVAGGLNEGYLNSNTATINLSSTDRFANEFNHVVDYDNDDITYHYTVTQDGESFKEQTGNQATLELVDLNEGSTYVVNLLVTDNVVEGTGSVNYVSSNTITFTVDTERPVISMSEPDSGYVDVKAITIDATDSISGVTSLEYKRGESGTLTSVPDDKTIVGDHGTNHIIVIAKDLAGNTTRAEEVYLVDNTPPEIESVTVQDLQPLNGVEYITSNQQIYTRVNFTDDLTGITTYHYGIIKDGESVSDLTVDDLEWENVVGLDGYRGEQRIVYPFEDGHKYYPVFRVTNSVGRFTEIERIGSGFYVDGSAPVIDSLNITGTTSYLGQMYAQGLQNVTMTPDISDPETQIKTIKYGISESLNNDSVQWYNDFASLQSGTSLTDGKSYYFVVRAENYLNLVNIKYSDPFKVDSNAPIFNSLIGGEALPLGVEHYTQRHNDYLKTNWIVDDISPIKTYYYKVGSTSGAGDISQTFVGADGEGWVEYPSHRYEEELRITKPDGTFADGSYYITLKAIDIAGNEATATTGQIEVNTQLPPIPIVTASNRYLYEKDKIYFTVEMNQPLHEVVGYQYWITDAAGIEELTPIDISASGLIQDVEDTSVSLVDGTSYFIYVKALYSDGTYTDEGYSQVTIDSTRPENLNVVAPLYASDEELSLSWQATEDYSLITYQVKFGTSGDAGDILGWTDLGRAEEHIFTGLNVTDGQVIYATVRAENSSGLWSTAVSTPITIDNTAPPAPVVIDEGMYSTNDTQLSVDWRWTPIDPESGIREYQLALLTSRNIDATVNWVTVDSTLTSHTFVQGLTNGQTYYMAVRSVNKAGLMTMTVSDGILVDTSKPEPPRIDDKVDYTDQLGNLTGEFIGAIDPESGIESFYYSLGTYTDPISLVDDERVEETAVTVEGTNLNLEIGEVYFFEARAKNHAGLLSASTMSNGVMVIDPNKPVVMEVLDGGVYSNSNTALSFVWEVDDSTVPTAGFQYALIQDQDQIISDADWEFTTDREVTLQAIDLFGVDQVFSEGTSYYLAVRATNILGTPTTQKVSNGITIDTTPPENILVHTNSYTNNNFHLRWDCDDPHSGIKSYLYAVGTTRGGSDVTEGWEEINADQLADGETIKRIDRYITLDLQHHGRYYLTVKAVNNAGLWSLPTMSSVIIGDLTAPAEPVVTTEFRNTPGFTNNKGLIEDMFFNSSDDDSGIIGYRYQVVQDPEVTGDLTTDTVYINDYTQQYENSDLDITGLSLEETETYYVVIQCLDGVGNWSTIGISQPIIVDTIPADLRFDTDLEELVTNDGKLKVGWSTNEAGTLYYRLVKLDSTGEAVNDPRYGSRDFTSGSDNFNFDVSEYATYEYQIFQIDQADNPTEVVTQKVRYNKPPVVEVYGDTSDYKGHTIQFTSKVTDDAGLHSYTWKIGEFTKTQLVNSDPEVGILDHTFTELGTYSVELTVEDADGASTTESLQVLITNTLEGKLLLSETWTDTMNLRGTVEVPEGLELVIETGTRIVFPDGSYLIIDGTLSVSGTKDLPVYFTGTFWEGVLIRTTATVNQIDYAVFEKGTRGLIINTEDVLISNCFFVDNEIGLHIFSPNTVVANGYFDTNLYYGIKEEKDGSATVTDSIFKENGIPYYHAQFRHISEEDLNALDGNDGNLYQ